MTDQLEPGPELDKLVAEALGWECSMMDGTVIVGGTGYGGPPEPMFFSPSSDFTAAMLAAEEFGLFEAHKLTRDGLRGDWFLETDLCGEHEMPFWAQAPTGPLVISRAIASLAQRTGERK